MVDAATSTTNGASAPHEEGRSGKVVQMRQAVQARAGALSDWAQDRAKGLAATAKERPLAAAGVSAGTAFAFGVVVGLLLSRAAAPPEPDWKERLMQLKPNW